MKTILDAIASITVIYIFLYWVCFFIIEKLLLFTYKRKADIRPRAGNWIMINYWQFFGGMVPFAWLVIRTYSDIEVLDIIVVAILSLYYGLIKPGAFKKGALLVW